MKLINGTMDQFIELFGEEVLEIAVAQNATLMIARNGDLPDLERTGKVGGTVVEMNMTTREILPKEGPIELVVIVYPDTIKKQVEEELRGAAPVFQARYLRSVLVHELKHHEQVIRGDYKQIEVDFDKMVGKVLWKGLVYDTDLSMALTAPWEKEAYIHQFNYLSDGKGLGEKAYEEMLKVQG